jgi:YjbR
MALSLPSAIEAAHRAHPDFRVGGKIFATLGYPQRGFAMVQLTPEQQELFVRTEPKTFRPVPGGWGKKGSTHVLLRTARNAAVREALSVAYHNRAPK